MIFLLITHPSCLTHLRINEFVMFHIQRVFSPPLKRAPNHEHDNATAECKPMDQMFVDESSNPCAREHITQENKVVFLLWHILLMATWASAPISLLAQVFIVDIYWLLSVLHSHNTKTTTWLDPRLAKKAKPPEKCEDGGMWTALLSWSTQAFSHSINYCTMYLHKAYLCCICHIT